MPEQVEAHKVIELEVLKSEDGSAMQPSQLLLFSLRWVTCHFESSFEGCVNDFMQTFKMRWDIIFEIHHLESAQVEGMGIGM
ncbi:hypothetical protein IFM89_001423 [Coptis chinensis]|uniref:Uncharacterized protein n=1 Tax=Coptis chinensis TaxID=261450 RepID=A0A835H2J1_9MAGN|nr:hypothetical protein IFM89_001423 [Coptis chinensis]